MTYNQRAKENRRFSRTEEKIKLMVGRLRISLNVLMRACCY